MRTEPAQDKQEGCFIPFGLSSDLRQINAQRKYTNPARSQRAPHVRDIEP
jgi:hypothetical protein